jgi:hypothetical protein
MSKPIHHPLGFCPVHGVFPAKVFALGPSASVHIENCGTNCPTCNGPAEIISALYEAKADRLNVLLHPSISPEALAAIRQLALDLQQGKITPAQAARAAKKIHPLAARVFEFFGWSDPKARATYIVGVVGVATTLLTRPASPPTVIVQPVIERILPKNDIATTGSITRPDKIPLPRPRPKQRTRR